MLLHLSRIKRRARNETRFGVKPTRTTAIAATGTAVVTAMNAVPLVPNIVTIKHKNAVDNNFTASS